MERLTRRTCLRGVLALPLFETTRAIAARAGFVGSLDDAAQGPRRFVTVYVPNGIHMPDWTPTVEGPDFELRPTLAPLAGLREDLLVLSGLAHDKAAANGDGPGDHARSAATFLTGAQAYKTAGSRLFVGVSADQVVAREVGKSTRFPSLELGCEGGRQSGQCDSGYSCAYSNNISWRTPSLPMAKETRPRLAFERLFGAERLTPEERRQRRASRRSLLDFVRADARALSRELSGRDRERLDEYMTAVRELELRLERPGVEVEPTLEAPEDARTFEERVNQMYEIAALALQADLTRVLTLMVANEGSNRSYDAIDAPGGHHTLSHHGSDPEKLDKIARINRFHLDLFARFLERLASVEEGGVRLLDQSMVLYGSGLSDGNRHNHDELPILLAGSAGGAWRTGRHVRYPRGTPAANLLVRLARTMGCDVERHGDSTGVLELPV